VCLIGINVHVLENEILVYAFRENWSTEVFPIVGELWLFVELGFLEGERLRNLYGEPDAA